MRCIQDRKRPFAEARLSLGGKALFALVCLVLCLSGCQEKPKPLQVLRVSVGKLMKRQEPIEILFRQPGISAKQIGSAPKGLEIITQPALKLKATWSHRHTIRLESNDQMKASTRYQIALSWPTRELKYIFSFDYKALTFLRLTGVQTTRMKRQPTLWLAWNQPVKAASVLRQCHLINAQNKADIPFRIVKGKGKSRLAITPKKPLSASTRYTLSCDKVAPQTGELTQQHPFRQKLKTHPTLHLLETPPAHQKLPYNQADFTIRFSTPVKPVALERALSIKPMRAWAHLWPNSTFTTYRLRPRLTRPYKRFRIKIAGSLKDVYGQTLGKALSFSFVTQPANPQIVVERGLFVVEAQRGYPVWTQHMSRFQLRCAKVPANQELNALHKLRTYKPWADYQENTQKGPYIERQKKRQLRMKWERFQLKKPPLRTIELDRYYSKWNLTHVKLHKACETSSRYGLFVAEFLSFEDKNRRYRPGLGAASPHRVVVNVTDMSTLLKVGSSSSLLWVASLTDGKPVAKAKVEVYSRRRKLLFSGITDEKGRATLPGADALMRQKQALTSGLRVWVVVRKGDDTALLDGQWASGIQGINFSLPVDFSGKERHIRGFIQSDRGLYQPGEKVSFKGLLREVALGQSPRVPTQAKRIKILVTDAMGQEVKRTSSRISPFGGFSFDLKLSEQATLGDYHVKATYKGQSFQEKFTVQAFRKLNFAIKLSAPRYADLNKSLKVHVKTHYLFGAPLGDAQIKWKVQQRKRHIRFAAFPKFQFTDWVGEGSYTWWQRSYVGHPEDLTDGETTTDKQGKAAFSFQLTPKQGGSKGGIPVAYDYLIQATTKDESDQYVSKQVVVQAHPTDLYAGLYYPDYVWKAKTPYELKIVALSRDGKQVAAKAKLEIRRTAGWRKKGKLLLRKTIQIPANGVAIENYTAPVPGTYMIRVEITDKRGRKSVASDYIWMTGSKGYYWGKIDDASQTRMTLIANKSVFQPGETARLLAQTQLKAATALVTVERNGVLDSFVLPVKSLGEGFSLPIKASYAPNVFVNVFLIKGHEGVAKKQQPYFKLGMLNLKISTETHRLKVKISTKKKNYKPGQWVRGKIVVSAKDKPVKAEVSLSVADEGLLKLIAYQTPDPMTSFYAPWGMGIRNASNWLRLLRTKAPDAIAKDQGAIGGGGDYDDSPSPVRSKFVSSAYWAPKLITNAKGEIHFRFKAPDNLTAFRLMAVAADQGARFGAAESQIRTRLPLMVQPITPRFLVKDDVAYVGALIHNYTGRDGTVYVRAIAKGVKFDPPRRKLTLRNNMSTKVLFRLNTPDTQRLHFRLYASLGRHRDGFHKSLPVHHILTKETKVLTSGRVEDRTLSIPVTWKQESILPKRSFIELNADRTGLSELKEGLAYLVRYPYGCLEQTLSKTIPLLRLKDLVSALDIRKLKKRRMRRFIRAGIKKVLLHQHSTGHFSLWPESKPQPHLTAYAMYGLNEARRARLYVPKQKLRRGRKALKEWATRAVQKLAFNGQSATLAMAAFVLADQGKADTGLNAKLFASRQLLPTYGKAFLLRALIKANAPSAQRETLQTELLRVITTKGALATVKPCEELHTAAMCLPLRWYMSSTVRTSAIVLSALLEANRKHPMIPKLADGLKAARLPNGRWRNTQENIYALSALADLAKSMTRRRTSLQLTMGKWKKRRRLWGTRVVRFSRRLDKLTPGTMQLKVKGATFANARLTVYRRAKGDKAVQQGFTLKREYLSYPNGTALKRVSVGELVKVRLTVTVPGAQVYVALVDHLPAGLEPLNQSLATTAKVTLNNPKHWTYQALRDDRIHAFANRLPQGTHTFEYVARATVMGDFTARPALVEAMYQPEYMARTAKRSFSVDR